MKFSTLILETTLKNLFDDDPRYNEDFERTKDLIFDAVAQEVDVQKIELSLKENDRFAFSLNDSNNNNIVFIICFKEKFDYSCRIIFHTNVDNIKEKSQIEKNIKIHSVEDILDFIKKTLHVNKITNFKETLQKVKAVLAKVFQNVIDKYSKNNINGWKYAEGSFKMRELFSTNSFTFSFQILNPNKRIFPTFDIRIDDYEQNLAIFIEGGEGDFIKNKIITFDQNIEKELEEFIFLFVATLIKNAS